MIRGLLRVAARAITIQLEEAAAARSHARVRSGSVEQHATSHSQLSDPAAKVPSGGQAHSLSPSGKSGGVANGFSSAHALGTARQQQHHQADALPVDLDEEAQT